MFGTSTRPTYDPKHALEVFFHTPWQFYSDEDISRLGGILEDNGMREWSRAPRLYFVLRGVGQQRLISAFLELGIDDGSLPMQESALQSTSLVLSPAIVVSESLVQFSGFSEFGGENPQISLKFGANRANT